MRKILFRGKRKDNGEWFEGLLAKYIDGVTATMTPQYLFTIVEEIDFVVVDHETVGQYTGLTDKNGKKIFEGDIVAGALSWLEIRKNGIVTFRNGSFGLLWYCGEAEQFNPFTSMCNVEYEVIGNIHDNPELLKGGVEE